MAYREYKGNLFASPAQTLVNTVNCVGVMGKGVALEFRHRFPQMHEEYKRVCIAGILKPGQILPYRKGRPWILNFAVKNDWRHPSRMEWVESCLDKFVRSYRAMGITSVAMPWLGAMNGRLPWNQVHQLIRRYCAALNDIDVELVEFDPSAPDPLFAALANACASMTPVELAELTRLTPTVTAQIMSSVRTGEVSSLSGVSSAARLGKVSVVRLYEFLRRYSSSVAPRPVLQPNLL